MKAAGVILTYMVWTNWKELPFNLSLFLFQLAFLIVGKIIGKVEVQWREIWHAAQVSHVRLCLKQMPDGTWQCINFGWKFAKLDYWRMDMIDGKHFEYREPTFESSPEFIAAMIEYAEAQVGKRYDDVQLLSYAPHLVVWIIYPPCWGKEIKIIKALNRPGALEVCISGLVACLRWGERDDCPICRDKPQRVCTIFFRKYDTAVVPPCLVPLSKNWEVT